MKFLQITMKQWAGLLVAVALLVSFSACSLVWDFTQGPPREENTQVSRTADSSIAVSNTPTAGHQTSTPAETKISTPTQGSTQTQVSTATQVPTINQTITATKAPVPTQTAMSTQTPATTPTSIESPSSGVSMSTDKVAGEITLDGKVPETLKKAYTTLKNALSKKNVSGSGKRTIDFSSGITVEELMDVVYYVKNYNPQLFYVDWNEYSYSVKNGKVIAVKFNCTSAIAHYETVMHKVEQLVKEANEKPNFFERELYIHDWLVKNIAYDATTENCGNLYGALIEGKAKCEGYAKAFQYLMNQIGLETVLITGIVEENHMWNMIKLYGQYYFVDVTHDDPLPDETIPEGKEYLIYHSCFNVSGDILGKTHTWDEKGSRATNGSLRNADLQACTATEYGYYQVKGLVISNISQLQEVLNTNQEIQIAEVFFDGDMPNIETFKTAIKEFLNAAYPGKKYSYTYTSPSSNCYQRNVIRISWTVK